MENKKRNAIILMVVVGVLLITCLVLGITYAYWGIVCTQTKQCLTYARKTSGNI